VSRFIPVHATLLGIGVDCHAAVDTARSGKNDIGLTGRLVLNVDPQSELTRVSVEGASVIDFDDGDFELTGGLACSIANLVKPLIINIVVDQLSSSISGLVEQQLCAKCPGTRPFEDECGSEATSCAKGLCMEGDRCLQRLGIEGRMDVGSLLEGLGLKAGGVLDLSLLAGGFAMSKNEGLGLGVLAGLSPTSEAAPTCVPEVGAPTIENVPPDQAILGDVEAPVEHDLLLGVHVSVLDRLGWTLYRSGALCLDVEEGVLDTSLIGALLPSLGRLLDRRPVPVKVSLRPTKPPTFALGANTFDSQTGELTAPLVVLKLENAKIELQALVHERFVRIAQVHTDLTLPLGLRVDERGRLLPVPGDLSSLLSETNVELSGLLTEPPDAVSRLIQKAVDIFLPVLTDSLEAFQLPTLAGLELVVAQKGLSASADGSFLNVHAQLIPQQSRDAQTPTASCSTIPGSKGSKGLLIVVALVLLCSLRRKRGVSGTLVLLCAGLAALGACQSTPLGATDESTSTAETATDTQGDEPPSRGSSGSHADMAAGAGSVWASSYEEKYGDLLVGKWEQGQVTWRYVDGAPPSGSASSSGELRGGLHAVGVDVGQYTSLVVADSGVVFVAHHDSTHGALRLTRGADTTNGSFLSHEVDSLPKGVIQGDRHGKRLAAVGLHTSLALDSLRRPVIAYLATGLRGEDGAVLSELRVAWAKSAAPTSRDDWTIEVVDSAPIPCDGFCPAEQVCVPLPLEQGETRLQSRCFASETCRIRCGESRVCVDLGDGPKCRDALPSSAFHALPSGTGLWPSLAVVPGDELAISYFDAIAGDLRLARGKPGAFSLATLDSEGDVGAFSSLVRSGDGSLRIAYQDRTHGSLRYRVVGGEHDGFSQVVDSGARQGEFHVVGADAKLLDRGDTMVIAYQDQTTTDLLLAAQDQTGAWSRTTLSGTSSGEGFYICGAWSSDSGLVGHYVMDAKAEPIGRFEIVEVPLSGLL
jgi:hypothetical protein